MEQVINKDTCYAFFKLLVEFGDAYYVDGNQMVLCNADNSPVGIAVGKKNLPLALFKEGMKIGDYVVLNPLIDSCNKAPEREWFFQTRQLIIGGLVKRLITKVVEIAISKDEENDYAKLELVSEFVDKLDEKMLKEIERIKLMEWGFIFYDKPTNTAQLQSDIFNNTLVESLGNKVRKQTWEVFRGMMQILFGTSDIEGSFQHVATNVAIPRADAILHVMASTAVKLNVYTKKLLNVDLHPQIFAGYLEHLDKFQKLVGWYASGTGTVREKEEETSPVWNTSRVPQPGVSLNVPGMSQESMGIPSGLTVPGLVVAAEAFLPSIPSNNVVVPGFVPTPMNGYHYSNPQQNNWNAGNSLPNLVPAGM